jgi:hypothetical protein
LPVQQQSCWKRLSPYLRQIERFIGRKFKLEKCPDFAYAILAVPHKQEYKSRQVSHMHKVFAGGKRRRPSRWRRK